MALFGHSPAQMPHSRHASGRQSARRSAAWMPMALNGHVRTQVRHSTHLSPSTTACAVSTDIRRGARSACASRAAARASRSTAGGHVSPRQAPTAKTPRRFVAAGRSRLELSCILSRASRSRPSTPARCASAGDRRPHGLRATRSQDRRTSAPRTESRAEISISPSPALMRGAPEYFSTATPASRASSKPRFRSSAATFASRTRRVTAARYVRSASTATRYASPQDAFPSSISRSSTMARDRGSCRRRRPAR